MRYQELRFKLFTFVTEIRQIRCFTDKIKQFLGFVLDVCMICLSVHQSTMLTKNFVHVFLVALLRFHKRAQYISVVEVIFKLPAP